MTSTAAAPQLALPFDFSAMHTWTDSGAGLELTVTLTPTGTRLALFGPWPGAPEGSEPVRGVLWQAELDLADPRRTHIAPAPEGRQWISFPNRPPVPDCFTAPLCWAAEVGQGREGIDGLLMAMRRSLVLVARHLERLLAAPRCPTGAAAEQCCLWAEAV